MKCPHCFVSIHIEWHEEVISEISDERVIWFWRAGTCPNCKEPLVTIIRREEVWENGRASWKSKHFSAYPHLPSRAPVADAVPSSFKEDYREASAVLSISPKASAALSRRVLQSILTDRGYTGRDLAKQIDSVLSEKDPQKVLPTGVRETVDAIRSFGNFAAHPIKDGGTLQGVIEVEPEEAEWCLEIIEALFDHYYIRPAETKKRRDALNKKLQSAGKPPAKS